MHFISCDGHEPLRARELNVVMWVQKAPVGSFIWLFGTCWSLLIYWPVQFPQKGHLKMLFIVVIRTRKSSLAFEIMKNLEQIVWSAVVLALNQILRPELTLEKKSSATLRTLGRKGFVYLVIYTNGRRYKEENRLYFNTWTFQVLCVHLKYMICMFINTTKS